MTKKMRKGHLEILKHAQKKDLPSRYIKRLQCSEDAIRDIKKLYDLLLEVSATDSKYSDKIEEADWFWNDRFLVSNFRYLRRLFRAKIDPDDIRFVTRLSDECAPVVCAALETGFNLQEALELKNELSVAEIFNLRELKEIFPEDSTEFFKKAAALFKKKSSYEISYLTFLLKIGFSFDELQNSSFSVLLTKPLGVSLPGLKDIRKDVHFVEEISVATKKRIQSICNEENLEITVKDTHVALYPKVKEKCLSVIFTKYDETRFKPCEKPISQNHKYSNEIVIFYDTKKIYTKAKKGLVPLTIKAAQRLNLKYPVIFKSFFTGYCKSFQDSYIFKDILYAMENTMPLPPLPINSCIGAKTPDELMTASYKTERDINYNKLGICIGYALKKLRLRVDKKSQGILNNFFYDPKNRNIIKTALSGKLNEDYYVSSYLDPFGMVLFAFFIDKLKPDENGAAEIADYIRHYKKVSLRITSMSRIYRLMEEFTIHQSNMHVPEINIPKKSRFVNLRELLPDEFTWIKSRKKLIKEGSIMHHCVASYGDLINSDLCAIYHLDFHGEGYTIQFEENKGKYSIAQLQSKYNAGYTCTVKNFIEGFLA